VANNYCGFQMTADVMNAVGSTASDAFASMGGAAFTSSSTETFGTWVGDFQKSVDSFIVVAVCCFVISFIFMVVLRLFIKVCVWFAVFMCLIILAGGGGLAMLRSNQCAGVGMMESGQQVAVATAVASTTAANNAMNGAVARSEVCDGDGSNYTGVQQRTTSGKKCIAWGTANTSAEPYTMPPYTNLENNYCRNAYLASDVNRAATIWCYTTDTSVLWEECLPIGVITPVCKDGYAVSNEDLRKALEICAYALWVLAGVYVILVICFVDRIRLAIAVNQVAAKFVGNTPLIVTVPIVQALIGMVWVLLWAMSAAYLISQVPDGYTPKTAYASYAEAYGTETVPGKCTDKWPTGGVYKDEDDCILVNATYNCWKCSAPRYVFDWRFAVSFFVFLWNNAFNIAIGQCIIAGAVGALSAALGAQKNRVLVMVLRVLQCVIWCFEKCVKFLNKNAYIQIALHGTNFCTSAKKAFFLILRNALRFGTVALLGAIIHWIGFMFILVATVACGYFIITAMHPEISPGIPLLVYLFMSYVVAKLFMNVFGLAVDSVLQCFLACEEMGLSGDFVQFEYRGGPTAPYSLWSPASSMVGGSRAGVPTRAPAVVSNYSLRLRPASTCGRLQLQPTPSTSGLTGWSRPGVPTRAPAVVSNYSLRPASSLVGPVPVCPREHLRSSPTTAYAFDLRAHLLVPSRCAHASTCGRLQLQPTPSTCELTGWSRPGVPTRAPAVVSNYSLRLRPASSLVGPVPVCPREHLRSSPTTAYAFDLRAHWLVPSRCAHASTCGRLQLQPTPSTCELTGGPVPSQRHLRSRPCVPTRAPAVVSNYSLRLRPASSLVGPVPVCPREHLRSSPTTAYAFDLRAHWLVPSRCAHASTCGRLQLQPTPSTCELTGWSRPGVPMRAPAVVSNYSLRLRPASSLVGPVPVCPREHLRSSPTTAYAFDLRAHWLVPSRCAHACTCGRLQLQPTPSTCELTGWSRPGVPTRAPVVVSNYSLRLRPASSLVGPVPVCPREHLRSSPATADACDLRAYWLVPSRCAHASTCGRLQLQPTPSTCEFTGWSRPGVPTRAPAVVSNYSLRLRPASSLVGPVPVCPRAPAVVSSYSLTAFDLRSHWVCPFLCAQRAPAVVFQSPNYSPALRPASSWLVPSRCAHASTCGRPPTTAYAFDLRAHWLVPVRCAHRAPAVVSNYSLRLRPVPRAPATSPASSGLVRPGVPTRAPAVVSNYRLRLRPASSLVCPVPVCPREHLRSSPTSAYACDLRAYCLVPSRCAHASMANEAKVMPQANVDDEKYTRGGENDLSLGPVKNRSCTDCWCLVVLAAAWVVFVGVTLGGLADGDPSKLYLPRDYSGAYCDTEKNWNDGPNLKGFPKLAYTMNVTSTTNLIAKQLVCSSFAASALTSGALGAPLLGSQALIDAYLCDCCLVACAKCTGSLGLTDLSSSNLQSTISGKMSDLTGATSASNLFSPSGANGQVFSNMWEEATKYFNQVCLPDCSTNFATMNETYNTSGKSRSYTYSMSPDEGLYYAWTALKTGGPPQIQ
ncbi:unnamed protein product, partial [Polarella glacialis]